MVADSKEIIEMIEETKKKFKLPDDVPVETLIGKIQNFGVYYTFGINEIDILNPGVKSAFFLKNCKISYNKNLRFPEGFDVDLITEVRMVSKNRVELTDINGHKFITEAKNVNVSTKPVTIDLYLNLLQ